MLYLKPADFEDIEKEHAFVAVVSARDREMLCIPELPDDYDFDKTYAAVIYWCQKAFTRIQ